MLLNAGNDDDVDSDEVFQVPDAVFGFSGCQTATVAVNGELISQLSMVSLGCNNHSVTIYLENLKKSVNFTLVREKSRN